MFNLHKSNNNGTFWRPNVHNTKNKFYSAASVLT